MTAATRPEGRRRGEPMIALVATVLVWCLVRVAVVSLPIRDAVADPAGERRAAPYAPTRAASFPSAKASATPHLTVVAANRSPLVRVRSALRRPHLAARRNAAVPVACSWQPSEARAGERPASLPTKVLTPAPLRPAQSLLRPRDRRWSVDAWLFLRGGEAEISPSGILGPAHGGSQAGAVLRYALSPGSPRRSAIYARIVSALDTSDQTDLAAGVSARPLADAPFVAHVEARATRSGGEIHLRPAAFVSAGMDGVPITGGFTATGYAQAGYVGGRDATLFADGSLIAERAVRRGEHNALSVGAGAWGGAQRGAARLDVGPSATLRFRLGEGAARIALDYRLRIAGDARPASSVAVTLAAGF